MNSIEKLIRLIKIPKIEKELTDARTTSDKIVKADLNERINSDVVRLENIAKESNSEIVNARVGVDGNNYESLNNRIKHEVDQLQSQISNASNLPFSSEYISAEHSVKGVCKDMIVKGKTVKIEAESLIGGEKTYTSENTVLNTDFVKLNKISNNIIVIVKVKSMTYNRITLNFSGKYQSGTATGLHTYYDITSPGVYKCEINDWIDITDIRLVASNPTPPTGEISLSLDCFHLPLLPPTIKSVSETSNKISILSCGKNLFNAKKLEDINYGVGFKLIDANTNTFQIANHQNLEKDLIKMMNLNIKGKQNITMSFTNKKVSGEGGIGIFRIYFEDGTNKTVGSVSGGYCKETFTKRIDKLFFSYANSGVTEFSNIMISEVDSDFESYKEDKRDISLSGAFGQWNSINFNTSELIEGTFKKVLNGASGETYNFLDEGTNSARFYMDLSNVKPSQSDMICNKFKTLSTTSIDEEVIEIDGSKRLIIRILKSKLTGYLTTMTAIEKVNLFKTWLTTNNVEFYCQLSTPIITKLNLDAMTSYNTMTHVFTSNTDELSPTIECKIPCNTPAVISTLSARNTVLQSENNTLKSKNTALEKGQVMLKTENEEIKTQLDNQGLAVAESQFNNEYRFMVLESGGAI